MFSLCELFMSSARSCTCMKHAQFEKKAFHVPKITQICRANRDFGRLRGKCCYSLGHGNRSDENFRVFNRNTDVRHIAWSPSYERLSHCINNNSFPECFIVLFGYFLRVPKVRVFIQTFSLAKSRSTNSSNFRESSEQ